MIERGDLRGDMRVRVVGAPLWLWLTYLAVIVLASLVKLGIERSWWLV